MSQSQVLVSRVTGQVVQDANRIALPMSVIDVMALRDPMRVDSYLQAMLVAAKVFLGLPAFSYYKYN